MNEVGNLLLSIQPMLHEAIEKRRFIPLGGREAVSFNVRMIFATNKDLDRLCSEDKFMPDLLDRFNRRHLHIPPLRERREDIPVLTDHLAAIYIRKYNLDFKVKIACEVYKLLSDYDFPGNVRDLDNIMSQAFLIIFDEGRGPLTTRHITLGNGMQSTAGCHELSEQFSLEEFIKKHIQQLARSKQHLLNVPNCHNVPVILDWPAICRIAQQEAYEQIGRIKKRAARFMNISVHKLDKTL